MPPQTLIRFGVYEVDLEAGELLKDGTRRHIQDQPLKVLRVLLEHPGELVTRDQLKQAIAPDSTFGDVDHALNVAVAKLRTALNDPAEHPVYIETLHKRGYRFIAPVNDANTIPGGAFDSAAQAYASATASKRLVRRFWSLVALAALLVLVGAVAVAFWLLRRPAVVYQPVAFTTLQGVVSGPAFSPDGTEIAFAWQKDTTNSRIYMQAMGSVVVRALVDDPEPTHTERSPHWFSNGRSIAYLRQGSDGSTEIWQVPRTGGPARKLFGGGPLIDFDIAPDGKNIVVAEGIPQHAAKLFLVSLSDMSRRQVTSPEDKPWAIDILFGGDRLPRFSPDGRDIAFIRLQGSRTDLWRVSVADGKSERLSKDSVTLSNSNLFPTFTWATDGKSLIVVARRTATESTWWRFWLRKHRWEPMSIAGGFSPALSGSNGRLAFVQAPEFTNIWRFEIPRLGHKPGEPLDVTRSTADNAQPMYSPDGNRFTFCSNRTGHFEIYVAGSDGSYPVQLTFFEGKDAGSPRWSPDGTQIVFDYRPDDHSRIFTIEANGGPPRQLTFDNNDAVMPRYSRDGKWIYFMRPRKGGSDVWKMPSGGGTPTFFISDAASGGETTDGKYLIYGRVGRGIWIRPVSGGEEQVLIPAAPGLKRSTLVIVKDGFYYREQSADDPHHRLMFYDFATRSSRVVMDLPFPAGSASSVSISPDGRYYLEAKVEPQSNIMLIENFR